MNLDHLKGEMKAEYIEHMGSDLSVVNAARVSFDKESLELDERDAKLINYLAKNDHWTPFSQAILKFRITAPIFVARQLMRHTVGLTINEVSRRYVDDTPQFFIPEAWRLRPPDGIKQGSSSETIPLNSVDIGIKNMETEQWICDYLYYCNMSYGYYIRLLSANVAPEMARMVLPLSTMTSWIWTGSLYAWARICKQRLDPHAQLETRLIAEQIQTHCVKYFPISWEALLRNK